MNYDKSHFDPSAPVNENDGELERVWKSEYSLTDLVADDKFKSHEELSNRLQQVLGGDAKARAEDTTTVEEQSSPAVTSEPEPQQEESAMSFFERQLNED